MKKILKFLNLFVFVLGMTFFANKISAKTTYMPTSSYAKFKQSVTRFSFTASRLASNESENIKITDNKIGYFKDSNGYYTFYADVNSYKKVEYLPTNGNDYLVRLYFKNVGKIGDRSVDTYIDVTRLKIGAMWSYGAYKSAHKKAAFFMVKNYVSAGNQYNTEETAYRYSADQEIDVKIKMVWSDTQEVVDLPFITLQTDVDITKENSFDTTTEGWKAGEGYTDEFYVYSGTVLQQQSNGMWRKKQSPVEYDGDNSYLKAGVYANTVNGEFASTYYEGVCATTILVTSQYTLNKKNSTPVKSSVITGADGQTKDKVTSINDKITYNIKQNFSTQFVDLFKQYKSMSIKDVLPKGVTYESATVTMTADSITTDITNDATYGTLSYNESSHTLTYTFNEDFLSDFANYEGQVFNIIINTSVKDSDGDYENTATTYIDDASYESNKVVDTYLATPPTYVYVSAVEGMELPEEINTKKGSYKINDNNSYLLDERVTRNNSVPTGTQYNIYDGNTIAATWELINWDKDSDIMNKNGVEFIGSWKFTLLATPKTPIKSSVIKSDKNKTKEIGTSINDKIIYTINQELDKNGITLFKPYKSMSIKDVLPEGLKYVDATVTMKDGRTTKDITNDDTIGTLSYDSKTRTLTYTFNEEWVSDISNFKGQTVTITIDTKIDKVKSEYKNKATTYLDELSLNTNEVVDEFESKSPVYKYESITEGKSLPKEISTNSGEFEVSDNTLYLNDVIVNRKDDVKTGSIYNVYDKKKNLLGFWKLVEWDKDEETMTDEGIEFIGYWEYVEVPVNPKTGDNLYNYMFINIISIISMSSAVIFFNKKKVSYNII